MSRIGRPVLTHTQLEQHISTHNLQIRFKPIGKLHSKGRVHVTYSKCGHADTISVWRLQYGNSECRHCKPSTVTRERAQKRIQKRYPHVNIVEFSGMGKRVLFECTLDGHRWYAGAYLRHQCKKCSDRARQMTFDTYLSYLPKHVACLSTAQDFQGIGISNLTFKCLTCSHVWKTAADSAKQYGFPCPACARTSFKEKATKTHSQFLEDVHRSQKNTIVLGTYAGSLIPMDAECAKCGHVWSTRAASLLHHGCPKCTKQHSKPALEWLAHCHKLLRLRIRHFEHLGEFKIPGTKFRADGYNPRQRLVFEFLGDFWHGNPKTQNTELARQRYLKTFVRFKELLHLGFTIVYIWENDFYNGLSYSVVSNTGINSKVAQYAESVKTGKHLRNI